MPLEVTERDFMSKEQVHKLKRFMKEQVERNSYDSRKPVVRDWAILHLALDTGLRASEICALRVGDLALSERPCVVVRTGKGDKKRSVRLGKALRKHLSSYLRWKKKNKEPTGPGAFLFLSRKYYNNRGRLRNGEQPPLTRTALWRLFKLAARGTGLPERFSIHSCRHSYASFLYKSSGYNLRMVQKQLGHASIKTTQIYADVLDKDLAPAVDGLPQ